MATVTRRPMVSLSGKTRLTWLEAEALMDAVNHGIADLHDAGDSESLACADRASRAADKLGAAMSKAETKARG
jgi:hypothetical protein